MATEAPPKDRSLPHNADAERTVLGAVLVDNAAFNSAAEILTRDDFYREGHRRIFDAMAVPGRAQPAHRPRHPEGRARPRARPSRRWAGPPTSASLVDGVPRISSVEHWSRIIKEKAVLRNLIHAGNRIVQTAFEAEDEAALILDRAEKSIFDIAERRIRAGFVGLREIVKESFRTIDQLSQSKDVVTGLPTGFVDLDERTSGLQKGDLIIVAARPAMGKTSLCLNIAQNASAADGGDGGHLLPRDVEGAAGAPHALRRRARRRASPAHGQAATRRTGRAWPRPTPTSPTRRSSSTTRPCSPPSRCARSAAASRPSTASASSSSTTCSS